MREQTNFDVFLLNSRHVPWVKKCEISLQKYDVPTVLKINDNSDKNLFKTNKETVP